KLKKDGFELTFTKALENKEQIHIADLLKINKYTHHYHAKYGSPRIDEEAVSIKNITTNVRNTKLNIETGALTEGFVYKIMIDSLYSKDRRDTMVNKIIAYTVKKTTN